MVRPGVLRDFSSFHVETFFTRLPHREGFARKCAVENDRLEWLIFTHARPIDARIVRLYPQLHSDIFPMYIIDLLRAAFLEEDIEEGLDCSDWQVGRGISNLNDAEIFSAANQTNCLP